MTTTSTKSLAPGIYWYVVPGKQCVICEKRDDEDYVRFTSGGRQLRIRNGERLEGPIQAPVGRSGVGLDDSPSGAKMVLTTVYADPDDIELLTSFGEGDITVGLHRATQIVRGHLLSDGGLEWHNPVLNS